MSTFSERLLTEANTALSILNLYVGHQLGFFTALAELGATTSHRLADQTGCHERYVREWLGAMVSGQYLAYTPTDETYHLPADHAPALLDPNSPDYILSMLHWPVHLVGILPMLEAAFRQGGGVPYHAYRVGEVDACNTSNRAMFVQHLATWMQAMPDLEASLKQGGRILDVGCGSGWSSISLARAFPNTQIDALDLDASSIATARHNAATVGLDSQITFYTTPIDSLQPAAPYTLITAFECIHDMAYPVDVLRQMRRLLAEAGVVLVADEKVNDRLEDNIDFNGHLNYNFSVLHCLPQAMVFPNSAATGAVMGPATFQRYAEAAGFTQVTRLAIDHAAWWFYRCEGSEG